MPLFLIRAEAVNFEWSCFDTQDLSTLRGGSMLLMNAHDLIRAPGIGAPEVHGASQAIWSIEADDEAAAESSRRAIEIALTEHDQLKHATFVVDVVPATGDGPADMKALRARNRWQQYQQPTLAIPEPFEAKPPGKNPYCAMDFVRPAIEEIQKGKDAYFVSASVKARRDYGKEQKKSFYSEFLPDGHKDLEFANDLAEITSRDGCGDDDPFKHLDDKMAVIYFDGNKQGEMAADLGLADLKRFRDYARLRQADFLKDLLKQIGGARPAPGTSNQSNGWYCENDNKCVVRFETLLWGGDDILLVVPAWKGWEIVRLFFDHVTGVSGPGKWQFGDDAFTYSAGLVLCSHKASIHRMRELADDLLIQGKKQAKTEVYKNLLGYEVLESMDVAGEDLERWRAERLSSDPQKQEQLLLAPDQLGPIADMVVGIQMEVDNPESKISRRQMELLARQMRRHPQFDTKFDAEIEQRLKLDAYKVPQLSARKKLYHLAALWDYIA